MNTHVKRREINGKPVYSFKKHNYALAAWADVKRRIGCAPNVFTLDHHSDTMPAFGDFLNRYNSALECPDQRLDQDAMFRRFKDGNESVMMDAAGILDCDEHIRAALAIGVVKFVHGVVLSGPESRSDRKIKDDERVKRLTPDQWNRRNNRRLCHGDREEKRPTYSAARSEGLLCVKVQFESADDLAKKRRLAGQVLTDRFLETMLSAVDKMWPGGAKDAALRDPYVLDVDLDYLNVARAIAPETETVFHRIIKNSVAVTVAREPDWVKDLRLPGEDITSGYLFPRLLDHIRRATS